MQSQAVAVRILVGGPPAARLFARFVGEPNPARAHLVAGGFHVIHLLRVSNTEPLLRLVVEAATEEGLEKRKAELIGKIRLAASANPAE